MYAPRSCNPFAKIFYHPIDIALRWCDLMEYEAQILEAAYTCPNVLKTAFPQWPCLHANTEIIFDAVYNGELTYGCFGVSVPPGTQVDHTQLTIRHTDLKLWMSRYHPDQRPSFLFETQADHRSAISINSYLALQADRDALQLQLKNSEQAYQTLLDRLQIIGLEKENISQLLKTKNKVSDRTEIVYLHIIGALLNLLLGHSPSGKPHSVFHSQAGIVDNLTAHHKSLVGITKRTLDEKFAAAKRSLSQN